MIEKQCSRTRQTKAHGKRVKKNEEEPVHLGQKNDILTKKTHDDICMCVLCLQI